MFTPDIDPYDELLNLRSHVDIQNQQISELQNVVKELVTAHNAHSALIKQLTEQNTELLTLWLHNTRS
jgi:hypothetical protein